MTNTTDAINALIANDDDLSMIARDLLIDIDEPIDELLLDADAFRLSYARDLLIERIDALRMLIRMLDMHSASMLALDYSLCPMHRCDYAICFDDETDECATIRAFFPDHDT